MKCLNLKCCLALLILVGCFAYADYIPSRSAVVEAFIDHQKLSAISDRDDWEVGEILPIISKNAKLGVIGFVEVNSIKTIGYKRFELRLKLLRQSRKYFIQSGDVIRRMDLTQTNIDYIGTTELLIRQSEQKISSMYRPLFYQGFGNAETAQTLFDGEYLIEVFGNIFYGLNEWLTIGTFVPGNFLGGPNYNFKIRAYDSESTTLSTGISYVQLDRTREKTLNLNLYWDSTSSDALITHTFLSLGLIKWEGAAESAAIKALGSSSFQTGYELILDNWDRFLIGPNYNFEKKALGGYLSYIWVMKSAHFQLGLNASDITHYRLDPTDGYFGFFDLSWRF